jgi:hypothetical protein
MIQQPPADDQSGEALEQALGSRHSAHRLGEGQQGHGHSSSLSVT